MGSARTDGGIRCIRTVLGSPPLFRYRHNWFLIQFLISPPWPPYIRDRIQHMSCCHYPHCRPAGIALDSFCTQIYPCNLGPEHDRREGRPLLHSSFPESGHTEDGVRSEHGNIAHRSHFSCTDRRPHPVCVDLAHDGRIPLLPPYICLCYRFPHIDSSPPPGTLCRQHLSHRRRGQDDRYCGD